MTYNFDPDLWLENQKRSLDALLDSCELSRADFEKAMAELEVRYEEMVRRLDGTYRIPE